MSPSRSASANFCSAQGRQAPDDRAAIKVHVRVRRRPVYDETGQINFVDVTVDRATDTVSGARRHSPTRTASLIDGQLVVVAAAERHAGGTDRRSAVGADRRSGGRLSSSSSRTAKR